MTIKAVIRSSGWTPFGVTGVLIRRRGFVIKCMPNSPAGRDPLAKAVLQAMPCEFYDAAGERPRERPADDEQHHAAGFVTPS
jgi:hypothetical protein